MAECHWRQTATTPTPWASWLSLPIPAEALPPPGVEAILAVLAEGDPDAVQMKQAVTIFGWERAASTGDLRCAMIELESLWDLLESGRGAPLSRREAQHCLAEAWADAVAAERGSPAIDPLSGLHTVGYLYGRVQELDRISSDGPSPLVLLVIRWSQADGPWMRISRMMHVAAALRSTVRADSTLSQAGATMALALVPDDARSRLERISLTKSVESGELCTAHAQVDVFAVPDDRAQLPELLTRLQGMAKVDLASEPPSF